MKNKLFQKLNKQGFDKVTKNLVEFINKNQKTTFDDVFLSLDLTHDQTLIVCQIGENFFRVDGLFPKKHRDDYEQFMDNLEITVNNVMSIPQQAEITLAPEADGSEKIEEELFLRLVEDD